MRLKRATKRLGRAAFAGVGLLACCATSAAAALPAVGETDQGAWSFVSAPRLHPPRVGVRIDRRGTAAGLIFIDPFKDFAIKSPLVGQPGPLILDNRGNPLWSHPVPLSQQAVDFRAQAYRGKPVLTWWQGTIAVPPAFTNVPAGSPEPGAAFYIYDQHYRPIRRSWPATASRRTCTSSP